MLSKHEHGPSELEQNANTGVFRSRNVYAIVSRTYLTLPDELTKKSPLQARRETRPPGLSSRGARGAALTLVEQHPATSEPPVPSQPTTSWPFEELPSTAQKLSVTPQILRAEPCEIRKDGRLKGANINALSNRDGEHLGGMCDYKWGFFGGRATTKFFLQICKYEADCCYSSLSLNHTAAPAFAPAQHDFAPVSPHPTSRRAPLRKDYYANLL